MSPRRMTLKGESSIRVGIYVGEGTVPLMVCAPQRVGVSLTKCPHSAPRAAHLLQLQKTPQLLATGLLG